MDITKSLFSLDFGNFSSTAFGRRSNQCLESVLYATGSSSFVHSCIKVTPDQLLRCSPSYDPSGDSVYITNFKMLLGKSRSDLEPSQLDSKRYGAEVCFDQNDHPYFHCELNTSSGSVFRDVYPEELFFTLLSDVVDQYRRHFESEGDIYFSFSVPHATNNRAMFLMKEAASKIGLKYGLIINEPTAACIHYLANSEMNFRCNGVVKDGEEVLVFDIGAGTVDVSILRKLPNSYEVIGSSCNPSLGGTNIDLLLFDYVCHYVEENYGFALFDGVPPKRKDKLRRSLLNYCREAKESLSFSDSVEVNLSDFESFYDVSLELSISRTSFNRHIMTGIMTICEKTVSDALNSRSDKTSQVKYALLTGGSSVIPYIRQYFEENGYQLLDKEDAKTVVAKGAYIAAEIQSNYHFFSDPLNPPVVPGSDSIFLSPNLLMKKEGVHELLVTGIGFDLINKSTGETNHIKFIPPGMKLYFDPYDVYYTVRMDITNDYAIDLYREMKNGDHSHKEATLFVSDLDSMPTFDSIIQARLVACLHFSGEVSFRITDLQGNELGTTRLHMY